MQTQTLQLSQIRIDDNTQPRVGINEEVLAEYTKQLLQGAEFPPVTVFFDGVTCRLSDGFHRYYAHRRIGRDTITADVQIGGLRKAILFSVGANAQHGLRRSNEDKRKAVETLLTHATVCKDRDGIPWSNRQIAQMCHVSESTVRRHRRRLSANNPQTEIVQKVAYITRFGRKAIMNTGKIGKSRPLASTPCQEHKAFNGRAVIELPYDSINAATTIVRRMGDLLSAEIAKQILNLIKQ